MCQEDGSYKREEFYVQKFGNKRIVQVIGWTDDEALIYDLKCDLKYPMAWGVFFMHHEKLEPAEINTDSYEGPDIDRILKKILGE
jgi:hypothetical protein